MNKDRNLVRRYHVHYGSNGMSCTILSHTQTEARMLAKAWIGDGVPIAIPFSDGTAFATIDEAIDAESAT